MADKKNALDHSNYDPNKDLHKEEKGRKPLEPKFQGNPLNEATNNGN